MSVDIKGGYYFCFEGIPGCGKTTQSAKFRQLLESVYPNREILATREPGGSEIANVIRTIVQATPFNEQMDPVCEAYLYAASRAQTLRRVVKPALERNALVVADRSVFTSLTFQAVGRGLGQDMIRRINEVAVEDLWPYKTVFIDLDPTQALKRTSDKLGDKFESMPIQFFEQVRIGYIDLCTQFPQLISRVDGNGSVDQVFERVVGAMFGNVE